MTAIYSDVMEYILNNRSLDELVMVNKALALTIDRLNDERNELMEHI